MSYSVASFQCARRTGNDQQERRVHQYDVGGAHYPGVIYLQHAPKATGHSPMISSSSITETNATLRF